MHRPDKYFTETQIERKRELMTRKATLSADERRELEQLLDDELQATVVRSHHIEPSRYENRTS